jgi:hypothetical protein
MNKAFIKEEEFDANVDCPHCGTPGQAVWDGPLNTHIAAGSRSKLGDSGWFCKVARCEVAYFDRAGRFVTIDELKAPVYPKDLDAPMCACFGLTYDDVDADVREGTPTRVRALLARSKTPEARCQTLAADGRCCMAAVQELYLRLKARSQ